MLLKSMQHWWFCHQDTRLRPQGGYPRDSWRLLWLSVALERWWCWVVPFVVFVCLVFVARRIQCPGAFAMGFVL